MYHGTSLDWSFDESVLPEYALPAIIVYDDDNLNPVSLLTNLGELRWQLDNDLEVIVNEKLDNTPPISSSSAERIYVQPGDDLTFRGKVKYSKSGATLMQLPEQGLEVGITTMWK